MNGVNDFDEDQWRQRTMLIQNMLAREKQKLPDPLTRETIWTMVQQMFCEDSQSVIAFLRTIPEWNQLSLEDQIACIKFNLLGVLDLLAASQFNSATKHFGWLFIDKSDFNRCLELYPECRQYSIDQLRLGLGSLIERMSLDYTELSIMCAICISLDQRAAYRDAVSVSRFRDSMAQQLQLYEDNTRLSAARRQIELLEVLQEIRLVSHASMEFIQKLYEDSPHLHPLSNRLFQEIIIQHPPV